MPIFTAIATAIGGAISAVSTFIGGLGVIGGALLKIGLSVGLNLLAQALAGKPKKPGFSVQGKLQSGDDVPRSFIVGRACTAGSLVYANGWGTEGDTPNAYLTQVIALSDIPVGGINALFVNSEKCTVLWDEPADDGMGFPVEEYRKDGKDHCWINFYDGTQTAADPFMVNTVSRPEDGLEYDSSRVGYGMAYAIMTTLVHEELWGAAFPSFKFELVGSKFYDPSRDDTAGGAGDQRWDNPATWGGDGDHFPAVQVYNLLRGITYDDKWFYGLQGTTAAHVPNARWIHAIDKCRLGIDGPDGFENQYRSGGEIQVGAPIADAIEAMLTACAGRLAEVGHVYDLHVGAPEEAAFSITDLDIISTDGQNFAPYFGLDETINGIQSRYPNPDEAWNIKTAPAIYRDDLEVLDNNRRLMADPTFDLVSYPWQVQRLQLSAIEEARRFRRHTLTLPPRYWAKAVPNAFFEWNSDRNGYETKLFRIDGVIDRPNMTVIVDCTEVDPSDYDFDFETDYEPPVNVPTGPIRPSPQVIVDWHAEGVLIEGDGGSLRPGIKLYWDGDQPDVNAVKWEVKRLGAPDSEVFHTGNTIDVGVGNTIITQAIVQETWYEVRGIYWSVSGRPFMWSDWLDVLTPPAPAVSAPGDIVDDIIDRAKLSALLRSALEEVSQSIMRVRSELQSVINDVSQAVATVQGSTYDATSLLKVANDNAFVAILSEELIRITEDSAIYSSLNAVIATVEDPDTGLSAIGSIVEAQEIQISNNSDGISALVTNYNALDLRVTDAEGDILINASSISVQTVRVDQLNVAIGGTATAGSSTTITLAVGSSNVNNYYVGLPIIIHAGAGAGQTKVITAYNGSTRVATILGSWNPVPNNTSQYNIGNALGQQAMSSQINTVSTTVDGHTSSISTLASSYNGLALQYGILGQIDNATGGFLLTGFTRLDGSATFEAIISASRVTIANLSNLIRNGQFDGNNTTVSPSGAYDIPGWWIASGLAQVLVVAGSTATGPLPYAYCLRLNLASAFSIYTDYDLTDTAGPKHGFSVAVDQEFSMTFDASASTGSRIINIAFRVLLPNGTVTTVETWSPSIGTSAAQFKHNFVSSVAGRGYLRIERSSTSGVVYISNIELFHKNGADLIVDGTVTANKLAANSVTADKVLANAITTAKINGQAVTTPIFATNSTPVAGTGLGGAAAASLIVSSLSVVIPAGDTVYVKADFTVYLSYSGNAGWEFSADIIGVADSIVVSSPSGSTTRQTAVTISKVEPFTSATNSPQTIAATLAFRGEANVTKQHWTGSLIVGKR